MNTNPLRLLGASPRTTVFPSTPNEASLAATNSSEFRSGGTDLQERIRSGTARNEIVDLTRVSGLSGIHSNVDGSMRIGAATTIAAVADDSEIVRRYPGLAMTARGLATPQVRAVGSIAGNLTQRNRCWYFRRGQADCYQHGGSHCPAVDGNHLFHSVIDLGPCVAVHPSSIGMALLAYDATISIHSSAQSVDDDIPVRDLWGDGTDPTRDHLLAPHEIITAVHLPIPWIAERAAYHRVISRFEAEWPLVEAMSRLSIEGGVITAAAVVVGGVAPIPLRLPEVEAALVGAAPTQDQLNQASHAADARCSPLPQTGYKVPLLSAAILETLEKATGEL